jgi:hypothetical protein
MPQIKSCGENRARLVANLSMIEMIGASCVSIGNKSGKNRVVFKAALTDSLVRELFQ